MKVRLALGSTLASVQLLVTACGDDDDSFQQAWEGVKSELSCESTTSTS